MTTILLSRFDLYQLGAMAMTITETAGQTKTITLAATTASRYYHGDATDNTDDGVAPASEGTDCFGVALATAINAAGLDNTYAIAFSPSNGHYAITLSAGAKQFTITFTGAAGTRMRRALGFAADCTPDELSWNSTIGAWYALAANDRSEDTGPQTDADAGQAVSSSGRPYTVACTTVPSWRRWVHEFHSRANVRAGDDATGDTWTWDLWKEHHRKGERFLLFDPSVTTYSYANREATYALRLEGIRGLRFERRIPNSDLYWTIGPVDCWVDAS